MTCDPNTLSALSSKLRALTEGQLFFIRTFLLCKWANVAGMSQNYLPVMAIQSNSPASSSTYFFGGETNTANQTVYGNAALTVLAAGTIKAVYFKVRITNPGTAELVSHFVTLNNAMDIALGSASYGVAVTDFVASGLSQAVNVGDTLAIKYVTPAWVTPPTVVRFFGYVLIQ